MYRVYLDETLIYDLSQEITLINPTVKRVESKSGSFDFEIAEENPGYNKIEKLTSIITICSIESSKEVELFKGRVIEEEKDFYGIKQVSCEGELAFLIDSIQRPKAYHDMTVRGLLQAWVDSHNKQVIEDGKVAIKFSNQCAGEGGSYDTVSIYYKKGGKIYAPLNKVNCAGLKDKTFVIPATEFWVYWKSDVSNTGWGFEIDSISLTNEVATVGSSVSALPSVTGVNTSSYATIKTSHPYNNKEEYLWHYTHPIASDVQGAKTFTLGMVTVTDPNDSLYRYTNWENTLTCIRDKLISKLGGFVRVRNENGKRYLDYLADYDNTNSQVIEFGENLLDYSENTTAADIATCCIPLGARLDESPIEALEAYTTIESVNDGSDSVYIPEAVAKYGWVTKTVSFDDVHVPANLKTKGEQWLSDNQYETMTLKLTAVDLNLCDIAFERIKLGDLIRVKSKPHGMDRYFPVTELTIYLDAPEKNTVVLGKSEKNLTERSSTATNSIYSALEAIPTESAILKQAIDNATALITAATTGHVVTRPNEILIMDTDDTETAKKVWRWNVNGLGYSKTGYNGTYGTAITMDGQIVGQYIVAGSIAAEKLDATYRSTVEKQIELAEDNANSATDQKLTAYWTKVQVETSIKNTKDSILITAKEEATGYVDNKLTGYYSKAQIDVKTNSITQSVTQEVTNRQNAVTKLQASITTNANSIALKVSKGNVSSQLSVESSQVKITGNRLVVDATNFSLTAAGLATMKSANITGTFKCTNGNYWLQCSYATLTGGNGSSTYGSIDFSATYSNSSAHCIRIKGRSDINFMGKVYTSRTPDAGTVYQTRNETLKFITQIDDLGGGSIRWWTSTYTFINGMLT